MGLSCGCSSGCRGVHPNGAIAVLQWKGEAGGHQGWFLGGSQAPLCCQALQQGHAGAVAPVGCWSLSNRQRWSFLGTAPSASLPASLPESCLPAPVFPHPPRQLSGSSCCPHHPVRGQESTPGCLWASLNPDVGFLCPRSPTVLPGEGRCLEVLLALLLGFPTPALLPCLALGSRAKRGEPQG